MKVHRFIVEDFVFADVARVIDRDVLHQMRTVLRLKIGESIILCDGRGLESTGLIESIEKDIIVVRCAKPIRVVAEPAIDVTLYAALIKRDNFELLVQKAVEVGVKKIIPIITDRTIKIRINLGRLQTIIREAAEQSGRGILTEIVEPVNFFEALAEMPQNTIGFFCQGDGSNANGYNFESEKKRAVFIGPEGGWSEAEIKAAMEKKLQTISFGKLTMRAETAAIVAAHWAVTKK